MSKLSMEKIIIYVSVFATTIILTIIHVIWGNDVFLKIGPFFVGICIGIWAFFYGLRKQIEGAEKVLKNPPEPGTKIDLTIYTKSGGVWVAGPEPFEIQYTHKTDEPQEYINESESTFPRFKIKIQTKPTNEDFDNIYSIAKEKGLSKRDAFKLWKEKYPERVAELAIPWDSFRKAMKSRENSKVNL